MPKINSYDFGRIVIDGEEINSDLIIYPDGTIERGWWRKSGHQLCSDDITKLLQSEPDILIIGSGANGMMVPDDELLQIFDAMSIEIHILPTGQAIELYSETDQSKCVGLCLHLTC